MEGCIVTDLKVHSKHNCFFLDPEMMRRIQQETAVKATLEPGTNIIKIRSGAFNYRLDGSSNGEPIVLLWVYGGKVVFVEWLRRRADVGSARTGHTLRFLLRHLPGGQRRRGAAVGGAHLIHLLQPIVTYSQ
jgi:hypothetical protein